jgi:hypothetical protein
VGVVEGGFEEGACGCGGRLGCFGDGGGNAEWRGSERRGSAWAHLQWLAVRFLRYFLPRRPSQRKWLAVYERKYHLWWSHGRGPSDWRLAGGPDVMTMVISWLF